MARLENLTFEEWLDHIFDHPVKEPQWYFDIDADYFDNPRQCANYLQALFADPKTHTATYTDAQVAQGLWMLISETEDHLDVLFSPYITQEQSKAVINNMLNVFTDIFQAKCTPILSTTHSSGEDSIKLNPLNMICYMWWDIHRLYGKSGDPKREALDSTCLDVMQATLDIPHLPCQESALHGLGHWYHAYPERVTSIIATFIKDNPHAHPALLAYAENASVGYVL